MDKNDHPFLLGLSKEYCLENIERKISNGKNVMTKLDLLRNMLDENFNQVEENIHTNFNKLRSLLNEREDLLIKKLKKCLQQNYVTIDKEVDKIHEKLDLLYNYQKNQEKNEALFAENSFYEEYGSCLAFPRYQLCLKDHLISEIKKCGSLKLADVLLLNVDVLGDNEDELADINPVEYKCKTASEFKDAEVMDTNSISSSSSSAVVIFPEDENEVCSSTRGPMDLDFHQNEELSNKLTSSSDSTESSCKGLFSHLTEKWVISPEQLTEKLQLINDCKNEYKSFECKSEEKDIDVTVSKSNNYIMDFNARIKNILGDVKTCRKECFAQKEIDTFCSKIHIMS